MSNFNERLKNIIINEITGKSKAIFYDLMKSERIPEIVNEPQYEKNVENSFHLQLSEDDD